MFIGLLVVQYFAQRLAQFAVAWLGERYLLAIPDQGHVQLGSPSAALLGRMLHTDLSSSLAGLREVADENAASLCAPFAAEETEP